MSELSSSSLSYTSSTGQPPHNWHLFCRVVDNYGDIGVCWRLARQLHHQHGLEVTLWVDELSVFQALVPTVDPAQRQQQVEGVEVRHWSDELPVLSLDDIGEVVIEAFGCDLPVAYLEWMKVRRPVWINLEYLSAEAWVQACHLAPSPQHGLKKFFFFPGFTAATGGLLWEAETLRLAAPVTGSSLVSLLQELGLEGPLPAGLNISLFAYENVQLPGLLQACTEYAGGIHLLVPQGRISQGIRDWLGEELPVKASIRRGHLTLSSLPFMSQPQYDRLLAACDLNFVRGEDSFVRCQMLARPLIWQIYPQQESAHLFKLEAFLAIYCADLPGPLADSVRQVHRIWNAEPVLTAPDWADLLDGLLQQLPLWQAHARSWQGDLQKLGDLASNLVIFSRNQV